MKAKEAVAIAKEQIEFAAMTALQEAYKKIKSYAQQGKFSVYINMPDQDASRKIVIDRLHSDGYQVKMNSMSHATAFDRPSAIVNWK